MKKSILLSLLTVALSGASLFAQQESYTKDKSMYERMTELEKKTEALNIYLNMQGGFNSQFQQNEFQQGRFNMQQLRLEARGTLRPWLSYRWRQQLNRPNNGQETTDNLPTSIDVAEVGLKPTERITLFLGKQCVAYGGIEFDLNPIEVYEFCDMLRNMEAFMSGVNLRYDITDKQQLQLQIVNSSNYDKGPAHPAKPENANRYPLLYTLNWNASMLHNHWQTRWSASYWTPTDKRENVYLALGNQINVNRRFNMYFDAMYLLQRLDNVWDWQRFPDFNRLSAKKMQDLSLVLKLNYRITPKWNLFAKGMYETTYMDLNDKDLSGNPLVTSYGYLGGLEYFPAKDSNFHFFLTYIARSRTFSSELMNPLKGTSEAGDLEIKNSRVSLGFIYQLPMF